MVQCITFALKAPKSGLKEEESALVGAKAGVIAVKLGLLGVELTFLQEKVALPCPKWGLYDAKVTQNEEKLP